MKWIKEYITLNYSNLRSKVEDVGFLISLVSWTLISIVLWSTTDVPPMLDSLENKVDSLWWIVGTPIGIAFGERVFKFSDAFMISCCASDRGTFVRPKCFTTYEW